MTKDEAIKFMGDIECLCEKHDMFLSIGLDKRPDLKMIRMEVFIKIDQEKKH